MEKVYLVDNNARFKFPQAIVDVSSISEEGAKFFLANFSIVNVLNGDMGTTLYRKLLIKIPMRIWGSWDSKIQVDDRDIIIIVNKNGENDFNFTLISFKNEK